MYLTLHTQLVGELQNLKQIQEWLMWKKIQNFYFLCYSPHAAQFVTQKLRYKDDEFGSLDKMSYKNLEKQNFEQKRYFDLFLKQFHRVKTCL